MQEIKKFEYIDSLRGIATLGVIAVHASQQVLPKSHTIHWLMEMGASGVQLFYIASAITLCMSLEAGTQWETHPIRNFYIRRFFRIAPLFWLTVIFYYRYRYELY